MNNELVERLETKIAFLERATNELSDVVFKQQQDIVQLNDRLSALASRFDAAKVADDEYTAADERPPHY
jgi:SlyX protein